MLELLADIAWAILLGTGVAGAIAAVDTIFFDDRGERWLARKLEREP